MKTDLFQSCGHCWVFQICWHIENSTCTASSFRIWNSSTGIPSPPLVLFIVMLSKAHLTSHSKYLTLDKWSHHHDYLGREDLFLYSSSVYSCHLLISSASVRSIPFLSFIEPIFAWNVPMVSLIFLEEISSPSHSVVFLYFFAFITEEGFLVSSCYSLELCIQMLYLSFSPLLFFKIFLYFYFYFILLYNTVLVLPYIDMNPPQVYMSSQTWTPIWPPTPYHLSRSSPCKSPKHPVNQSM